MKKIISALICVCILMTMASAFGASAVTFEDKDISQGVLLYYWHNDYAGSKYTRFTDSQLRELNSVTNEFIMIPIVNVNYYVDKQGDMQEIISVDDINSLTLDDIEWTSNYSLQQTKQEYMNTYSYMAMSKYTLNDYVDETVEFAQRLVSINPDVRLWFSVPATAMHALSDLQGPVWNEYVIDAFKEKVGSDIWDNNIQGIYFANEDAYPGFTKFNYNDPENDFDNQVVMAMRDVSDKIHSYGKSMVWIPYCIETEQFGWEMYQRIGYIANKTDIFDAVTIQPKIYFGDNTTDEIGFLKESLDKQAFVDPDTGEILGGTKTSSTNIGIEIELDGKMISDSEYYDRFYEQFNYFKDYVGTVPFTFYPGTPEHLMMVKGYIAEFLGTDDVNNSSSGGSSSQSQTESSNSSSSPAASTGSSASSSTSSVANPSTGSSVTMVTAAAALCAASVVAIVVSRKRK